MAASALRNTQTEVLAVVREIAATSLDDGIDFDHEQATAEVIREEDDYSGIRVTLGGMLSRATVRLHVDVNIGDPIWPEPQHLSLPRLLDGVLQVRGYPRCCTCRVPGMCAISVAEAVTGALGKIGPPGTRCIRTAPISSWC